MNPAIHIRSYRRAVLVAIIIVSLTAGVAFAILQSIAQLTGNTISTASANLLVSTDAQTFDRSVPGFNFAGLVPGGYPAPAEGYSFYLKNTGSSPLALSLALDNVPTNSGSADLTKLNFTLTDESGGTSARNYVLASLVGEGQPVEGELGPGQVRRYKLQALAADSAKSGVTVGNINLAFTGIARDLNAPTH